VFCQVNSQFLPARTDVATKPAWLVLGLLSRVATTSFDNGPNVICLCVSEILKKRLAHLTLVTSCCRVFVSGSGTLPWLSYLVLTNEMLHEVVLAIAGMVAVCNLTCPVLQLTVSLVLMSNPVRLALERFRFPAIGKGARERLYVFMHMFGPIGRLVELFDLETQRAFELGW